MHDETSQQSTLSQSSDNSGGRQTPKGSYPQVSCTRLPVRASPHLTTPGPGPVTIGIIWRGRGCSNTPDLPAVLTRPPAGLRPRARDAALWAAEPRQHGQRAGGGAGWVAPRLGPRPRQPARRQPSKCRLIPPLHLHSLSLSLPCPGRHTRQPSRAECDRPLQVYASHLLPQGLGLAPPAHHDTSYRTKVNNWLPPL
jgi:hypothetical protein